MRTRAIIEGASQSEQGGVLSPGRLAAGLPELPARARSYCGERLERPPRARGIKESSSAHGAAAALDIGGEHMVPERGDDAVIAGRVVIMMGHVLDAGAVEHA